MYLYRATDRRGQTIDFLLSGKRDFNRAASGLKDFSLLLHEAAQRAPAGELIEIMDFGFTCAYLATAYAKRLTGSMVYVDGRANIVSKGDAEERAHMLLSGNI